MSYTIESDTGFFISNGTELNYKICRPQGLNTRTPGVVLVHGAASEGGKGMVLFDPFQEYLGKHGICSISYDSSGVGKSRGKYCDSTLWNRLEGAEDAYIQLLERSAVEMSNISILGVSMGGHVVARIAGMYPEWFTNAFLINPAAYGADAEDKKLKPSTEFTEAIRKERSWEGSPAFSALRNFFGNVLLFRSENDTVISPEIIARYIRAAGGSIEKIIIPNVPHALFSGTDDTTTTGRQFLYSAIAEYITTES